MRYLLMITLAVLVAACSPAPEQYVLISGQVENPAGEEAEIYFYLNFVNNDREQHNVPLDEDGAFTLQFVLDTPREVFVHVPRRTVRLYLEPGAQISLSFDADDMNGPVEMEGDNVAESAYMQALQADISRNYGMMTVLRKAGEKDPEAFHGYVRSIYDESIDHLEAFPRHDELSEDFRFLMRTHMRYEMYRYLLDYPMARSFFGEDEEEVAMPADYYDFLHEPGVFDDAFTLSRHYFAFLNSFVSHRVTNYLPEDEDLSHAAKQFYAASGALEGKSRDMVLAEAVISALNFGDFEEALSLYQEFLSLQPVDEMVQITNDEYETIMALAPGRQAPGFQLTDIDGQPVSLSDFAGKVVYLDFWASWCGPCLQQIPHAKELKERMADQDDLVFLYVSVDTDEAAWRRAVDEHQIRGVHLNVPGFDHEVPSSYNLKGVPTFYLIGRDGEIVDNRPPRPSHEGIDEVLLAALAAGVAD